MVYSLRNLLISFSIILVIVLLIVLRTFSTLQSQEKEHQHINQSRNALQKLGPALIHVQEFESIAGRYLNTNDQRLLPAYTAAIERLRNDSAGMTGLGMSNKIDGAPYHQLASFIHRMIIPDTALIPKDVVGAPIATIGYRMSLVDQFKEVATRLEAQNRQVLEDAYSRSITLTRETVSFMRFISVLLILVLIISFWFVYNDIRNRKKGEEKLKEFNAELEKQVTEKTTAIETSGKNLRQALSSFTDVFYVVDKDYRITMINEMGERDLSISWGQKVTIGGNVLDLVPREKYEEIKKQFEKVMRGERAEYEAYQPKKDLPLWVLVTFSPVIGKNGEVIGASVTAKDISARKAMESELREAESKFRNLVEQSLIGVYIIRDGKFAYVNPRFAAIFGYSQSELINTFPMEAVIHPCDREKVAENVRARITKEKESIHYEARGMKKNGGVVAIEVFCSGTLYESQPAIIGTLLDISERKKIEKEKEHIYYLLNERVKELTTLNNISQVFQQDTRSMQETLQAIVSILPLGWQYPDITAARITIGDLQVSTPNFGTAYHRQSASFPTPDGPSGMIEIIYLAERPRGVEDAFLTEERNLINIVAEMLRIYFSRQHEADIVKKMQQEILKQRIQEQKTVTRAVLNAEERERNKIGRELHDNVNQILASAKLFLKMANENVSGEQMDLLKRSSDLLESAIEEIRMLSQSQVTPVKEVDLKELIQTLVDRVNDSTSITTRLVYENGRQIADDLKLNIYRIVQEQINNILKYAGASSIGIIINAADDLFHVIVEDNGKGFDPSKRRKGVGISNMINRVESFNGKLTIISAPGKGCRIDIKIPC